MMAQGKRKGATARDAKDSAEHAKPFCVYTARGKATPSRGMRLLERIESTAERKVLSLAADGVPEVIGIGHSRYRRPQPFLPEHIHPNEIEIHYCHSGLLVFEIDGVRQTLSPGSVCLTQPAVRHHLVTNSKGDEHDWLLLRLPKRTKRFLGLGTTAATTLLRHVMHIRTPIFRVSGRVPALFAQIHDARQRLHCRRLRALHLQALVVQLLIVLAEEASHPPRATCDTRFADLVAHMRAHPEERLSNAAMAQAAGLCESRFLSAFKQATGLPPAAFRAKCRVEEAKRRLRETAQTLTAMALDLGYSSAFHLSAQFKDVTGFSPSEYRAAHSAN